MDTCKFKSISINETESSNGASFQEGELEYTFSLPGPDCEVHSAHSALYWNERCAAWLPERVKSFWEIEDSEDGYMAVFFSFIIPSLIHLLIVKEKKVRKLMMLMAFMPDNVLIMSKQTMIRLHYWWWFDSEMKTQAVHYSNCKFQPGKITEWKIIIVNTCIYQHVLLRKASSHHEVAQHVFVKCLWSLMMY